MSRISVFTSDELQSHLNKTVSSKRYVHSLGVAETTGKVLEHFGITDYEKSWHGFEAATFCGLSHDLARELSDARILEYCRKYDVILSQEDIDAPVLAHGKLSAEIARRLVGRYPDSWYRALCDHTTGNAGMDSLGLALFVADYIEPGRKFMTDEKRSFYLLSRDLRHCAYRVLYDMMEHWEKTGFHSAASGSVAMRDELEGKYGCSYE